MNTDNNGVQVQKPGEAVSGIEKFLFEVSFDDEAIAEAEAAEAEELAQAEELEAEEEIITFTEEELEAARAAGYESGRDDGIREAADAIETKINDSLGMIIAQFGDIFRNQTISNAETFTDAINVAVAIARKCFPHYAETHGVEEIIRMVREVLAEVLEEPRVIIHVHPTLKDVLGERLDAAASDANFEGQVILLEVEEVAPGDCRITWSSGSAERDMDSLWRHVDKIVEDNLSSVREQIAAHAQSEEPDPASAVIDAPDDTKAAEETADGDSGETAPSVEEAAPDVSTEPPQSESAEADSAADAPAPDADTPAPAGDASEAPIAEPELDSPEGPAPTPSEALAEDPPEPQESAETMDLETDAEDVEPHAPMVAEEIEPVESADDDGSEEQATEAHLTAGPGIVEPGDVDGILEDAPDAAPEGMSPDAGDPDDGEPEPGS